MEHEHRQTRDERARSLDRDEAGGTGGGTFAAPEVLAPLAAPAVPGRAATVRRKAVVGAADDPLELEAEAAARRAVAVLARPQESSQGAGAHQCSGEHVHRSTEEHLHRSGGAAAAGAIGAAGGELDDDSSHLLGSLRGKGAPLALPVRRAMEGALGSDLSGVRVHTGANARRLNHLMSAEAFTVGKDVFFRDGMPSMGSASGQSLLAHELAHTVQAGGSEQSVHRLFGRSKSPEEKQAAQAKADLKKQAAEAKKKLEDERKARKAADRAKVKEFEKTSKAEDKQARQLAKVMNTTNKMISKEIIAADKAHPNGKLEASPQHRKLIDDFSQLLKTEAAEREAAHRSAEAQALQEGKSPDEAKAAGELAAEQMADEVWANAPFSLRAFRPLRFDEFDRALNEVKQVRTEGMAQHHSDVSAVLQENEDKRGAFMDVGDAEKAVNTGRALNRRRDRIALEKGKSTKELDDEILDKAKKKAAEKEAEKSGSRAESLQKLADDGETPTQPGGATPTAPVPQGESQRNLDDAQRKKRQEAFGDGDKDLQKHAERIGYASTATKYLAKGTKAGAKQFGHKRGKDALGNSNLSTDQTFGTDVTLVVDQSVSGLAGILNLIKQIIGLVDDVGEIRKGGTDKGATREAVGSGAGIVKTALGTTKTGLLAAKEGLQAFAGPTSAALSGVTHALPIVGMVGSVIDMIISGIDSVPLAERLWDGAGAVYKAKLDAKAPLVAALERTQRRNGQLIEKKIFSLVKSATMMGLHIAEIATAGGFGIPTAAKISLQIVSFGHTAAHKIADYVIEQKAANALHAFRDEHKEGASRDVVKYDAGTAVDLIIVAAQKHKLPYAISLLEDYGITPAESASMRIHEIRNKVLKHLKETDSPRTVQEKAKGVLASIKSFFGMEDGPKGLSGGEERSLLDKLKDAPAGIASGLKSLGKKVASAPKKIGSAIADPIREKYQDAKTLVEAKDAMHYKGKSGRSVAYNFLRSGDGLEKSLGKVRQDMHAAGADDKDLPYSVAQKEHREKLDAIKNPVADQGIKHVDQALSRRLMKLDLPQLYQEVAKLDLSDERVSGTVDFVVAARLQALGMPT
ncbi:MAG TPA: DUF4157 domain-containing protein [Marmoricola sp.]|nr:DUF4157 domain-containing protein [Marmoricola sp.]